MGKRIAGTCYIKVDGQQLELEGSLEFPLSQVVRESKVASGRVVGFGETKVVPYISGNFFVPSDETLTRSGSERPVSKSRDRSSRFAAERSVMASKLRTRRR